MKNKILIISGSSRKNGNTQLMAQAFADECLKTGNEVKIIELCNQHINDCLACDYCTKNSGRCAQTDDMTILSKYLKSFDSLVFATPVYYGGISARLKAVIDRFYALGAKNMAIKNCVLLTVAGRTHEAAADPVISYYRYLADFMGWNNCGEVSALGYEEAASISGSDKLNEVRVLAAQAFEGSFKSVK